MQTLYVLAAALTPIVVLMLYVYFKDKQNPEPTGMLFKGLWFGVLSTFLSLTISLPMTTVGLSPEVQTNFLDCLGVSFFWCFHTGRTGEVFHVLAFDTQE